MNLHLLIPEYETDGERYPGDIQPGEYSVNEVVEMLRKHKDNPDAIQFIADMLEV